MISKSIILSCLSMLSAFAVSAKSHYDLIGVSALQTHFNSKDGENNTDSGSFLGFGVNYLHGFRLLDKTPLYLETGGGMRFMFYTDHWTSTHDIHEFRQRVQMVTFAVPLNLAYKVNIGNDFSITPFAGIDVKAHLSGWMTNSIRDKDGFAEERGNLFNDDEDNMDGRAWTRFQTGWNAGLRLTYKHAFASASYGTDFAKLSNHKDNRITTQNICVTFGYSF